MLVFLIMGKQYCREKTEENKEIDRQLNLAAYVCNRLDVDVTPVAYLDE
jgi:hypothetical protein